MRPYLLPSLLLLTGCAARPDPAPEEVRMNAAVKERYWRLQADQRRAPVRGVEVRVPARVEDGARRVPTIIEIKLP